MVQRQYKRRAIPHGLAPHVTDSGDGREAEVHGRVDPLVEEVQCLLPPAGYVKKGSLSFFVELADLALVDPCNVELAELAVAELELADSMISPGSRET